MSPTLAAATTMTHASSAFLTRVCAANPFLDSRVRGPSAHEIDVAELHQGAFERLTGLAREACRTGKALGAVLWGEAGIGKSHLLGRLKRWADGEGDAALVYVHNLLSRPGDLPRAVLHAAVTELGRPDEFGRSALSLMVEKVIVGALGQSTGRYPSSLLMRTFAGRLESHRRQGPTDAALTEVDAHRALYGLFKATKLGDALLHQAALAWLRGDAIELEAAVRLTLPPRIEDDQQVKQVLVALTRLAAVLGRPFLVCFDQVDNLEQESFSALTRFLEALLDSSPNLLVVTAGVQASLLGWRERRVVQDSAWDRLAQFQVLLQKITPPQSRRLVAARIQPVLEHSEEDDEVRRMTFTDDLFPLGRHWFGKVIEPRIELRPRDAINLAREGWEQLQQAIEAGTADGWQERWQERLRMADAVEPLTAEGRQARIDRCINERLVAYQAERGAAGQGAPTNDTVAEVLLKLLQQCRRLGHYGILGVRRLKGRPPVYDVEVRLRGPADAAERRVGLVFALQLTAARGTGIFTRLNGAAELPARLLIVSDDNGLKVGKAGEDKKLSLQRRRDLRLEEVALSSADAVQLEALLAVLREAASGNLELPLGGGVTQKISENEVAESHHRQGRFTRAPLLGSILS